MKNKNLNDMIPVVLVSVLILLGAFAVVNAQGHDDRPRGIISVEVPSNTEPAVVDNIPKEASENAKKAFKHIVKTQGISEEQLEIVNEGHATFSLTKQKLWAGKVRDKKTGEIYGIYLDKNGNIADFKKAKEKENKAYKDKYGKLEPALYEKLQDMDSDDKIKVAIWLTPIDSEKIEKSVLSKRSNVKTFNGRIIPSKEKPENKGISTSEEAKEIKDEIFAEKKKAYKAKEKPLIDELNKKGFDVGYASIAAPVVFANLTKKEIFALEKRKDVDTIYLSKTTVAELNNAVPTIRAPYVWSKGYDGTGVRVAVVESPYVGLTDSKVDFNNPNLDHANDGTYKPNEPTSVHATMVASVIASNHNTYKGVSPNVDILSANSDGSYDDIMAASDWALNNNADILSCSFGGNADIWMDALDRYFDHIIWEHWRAVVKSVGNRGAAGCTAGEDGKITSPGLAYNVITVGGTNDEDTQHWRDDERWSCSSYVDPRSPHDDRNKPEVSAPAEDISVNAGGGAGWRSSGTSLAAPAVSGEIALLIDQDNGLVGKYHNIVH